MYILYKRLHMSKKSSTFAATLYYAKEDANEKDTKYDKERDKKRDQETGVLDHDRCGGDTRGDLVYDVFHQPFGDPS